jgi:DNA-binding ferritin-like protein
MPLRQTLRRRKLRKKTLRNSFSLSSSSSVKGYEREITVKFFEALLMIKLFHWKTYSFATHKATDELYASLNENMDKFMEILLGKTGTRIDLTSQKTIQLFDLNSKEELKRKIMEFKSYLVSLTNNKSLSPMTNTDLLNIRDEILGDLNQFLYLLTFDK